MLFTFDQTTQIPLPNIGSAAIAVAKEGFMSQQCGFIRRTANGLHSSICLNCFRTAGQSPHSLILDVYEMSHLCPPSERIDRLPGPPDAVAQNISTALDLLAQIDVRINSRA
jgi:hypothetical protein